jgi:superoxide dismutase, Fe-Mn family
MSKFEEYVKNVASWNDHLKDFLTAEKIQENEEIWGELNRFTTVLEGLEPPFTPEKLAKIQSQVDLMQEEMEQYFARRQQVGSIWMKEPVVAAGSHTLPPLPYTYEALEPHISREIMQLHHDKHHRSYVEGLNKAEKALEKARTSKEYSLVKHWSRELAFHGSGHYLHTIFWNNMKPKGGGKPGGKLLAAMESYFGSFEEFKKHFSEAASQVEGSGWAVLVWSPRSRHLEILQSEKHQNLTQWDTIPLLVLDVWEHAYYLQYKNNRADYIKSWWNVVNWKDVESRFDATSQLKWKPY